MGSERRSQLGRMGASLALAVCLGLVSACGGGGGHAKANSATVDEQLGLGTEGALKRQAQAENLIRDCMRAQGFEYVPVDPAVQQQALVGTPGLSKADFEKQYGYGITTLYEQRQRAAVGPNQTIRDALDKVQQAAYDRTLFGDDPSATFAQALDTGDFSRLGGCTKQAAGQVFGGVELIQSLQGKLDQLDQRIKADGRMVTAIKRWSRCMRDAGFDLADPDEVDTTLRQKLETIVGPPGSPNPSYDRAALTALQREEVATVNADIACEDKHLASVEEKVRAEYERSFREQNADLLSKVRPA